MRSEIATSPVATFLQSRSNSINTSLRDTYPVTVDYNISLADMVALGKYNHCDPDIHQRNFSFDGMVKTGGRVNLNIKLLYGLYSSPTEVENDIYKHGYRPVILPELLALGATFGRKLGEFSIVGLGSPWEKRTPHLFGLFISESTYVPFLDRQGELTKIDLTKVEDWFDSNCRFAIVHKSDPGARSVEFEPMCYWLRYGHTANNYKLV